ncbi:hypothetical protein V8C35DRAFT_300097 [Trichoderma chlorosporum]
MSRIPNTVAARTARGLADAPAAVERTSSTRERVQPCRRCHRPARRHCHTVAADLTGREKPSRVLRLHRCKGGRGLQPYLQQVDRCWPCQSRFACQLLVFASRLVSGAWAKKSLLKTLIRSIAVWGLRQCNLSPQGEEPMEEEKKNRRKRRKRRHHRASPCSAMRLVLEFRIRSRADATAYYGVAHVPSSPSDLAIILPQVVDHDSGAASSAKTNFYSLTGVDWQGGCRDPRPRTMLRRMEYLNL